jgi:hypothetical protein
MSKRTKQKLLGTIDRLALALAKHYHKWTQEERELYEQAIAWLQKN